MSTEELRQEIDRVVGECAGAVSMCWEPRPEGVFDSTQATTYVRGASDRLMSVLEAEIASRVESAPDRRNRPFPKQAEVEADVDRLWTQLRFAADGAAIDNHAEPQRIIVERAVKAALICALDNRLIEVTEQWPQWIRLEPSWQAEDPAIRERLTEGPES